MDMYIERVRCIASGGDSYIATTHIGRDGHLGAYANMFFRIAIVHSVYSLLCIYP